MRCCCWLAPPTRSAASVRQLCEVLRQGRRAGIGLEGPTQEMNANLADDDLIAEMYADDPERAPQRWGSIPQSTLSTSSPGRRLRMSWRVEIRELPPGEGYSTAPLSTPRWQRGFHDACDRALRDYGVTCWMPPRSKAAFLARQRGRGICGPLKGYGISRVQGDAYAGEWPRERFASHGIIYDVSTRNKSRFIPSSCRR